LLERGIGSARGPPARTLAVDGSGRRDDLPLGSRLRLDRQRGLLLWGLLA